MSAVLAMVWPRGGGGGSSIVKVPGDVLPARVCFFKPSGLAKGILFLQFWSKKCETSVIPVKKPKFFSNFGP